jgi:DNA-binding SARP family transcriptional activator
MAAIEVRLFGQLSVQRDGRVLDALEAGKAQELFCYLLLHRERLCPREVLAEVLWSDSTGERSKKYLRQALWQLHAALDPNEEPAAR